MSKKILLALTFLSLTTFSSIVSAYDVKDINSSITPTFPGWDG